MRIAVTGASGFIGGAVATALADRGHTVTGFGRVVGGWAGDYRRWDIAYSPVGEHCEVDVVVHCGALADDWASLAASELINVDGTRNVIASFPGARFVHLSTSSVYDAFTPTVNALESEAPVTRFLSHYSRTKTAAEALFDGLDAAILRPHAVYGPGDTTLLPRILAGVRGSRLTLPGAARVEHTLTHIDNLVDAVELAATSTARGIFNIGDATNVWLDEMLVELLAKKGRADVALHGIPYRVAFAAAGALELAHRAFGGRPRLTRYAVSQLGLERTLDLGAAREVLGYRPRETSLAGAETW
jgi:nucleoside-diphosphate-sugar epimerase